MPKKLPHYDIAQRVAKRYGVQPYTIRKWQERGCPFAPEESVISWIEMHTHDTLKGRALKWTKPPKPPKPPKVRVTQSMRESQAQGVPESLIGVPALAIIRCHRILPEILDGGGLVSERLAVRAYEDGLAELGISRSVDSPPSRDPERILADLQDAISRRERRLSDAEGQHSIS